MPRLSLGEAGPEPGLAEGLLGTPRGYRQCCGAKLCNETTCAQPPAHPIPRATPIPHGGAATGPGACFRPRRLEVTRSGRLFCASALLEGLSMVGFGIALLIVNARDGEALSERNAAFYTGVGVYLTAYFVYCAFDSVFAENKSQMFASIAMSLMSTAYILNKYIYRADSLLGDFWEQASLWVLIVKCAFSACSLILCPFVLEGFGYHAFMVVGTDTILIRRYAAFLQLWSLLRLDLVLNVAAVVTIGFLYGNNPDRLRTETLDLGLAIGAVAAGLLQATLGWVAATRESGVLLGCFLVLCAAQPAYIVYRLFFCVLGDGCVAPEQISRAQYVGTAALVAVFKLALVVSAARVACGFGTGLRTMVFDRHRSGPTAV